jgi:hypothetical protein
VVTEDEARAREQAAYEKGKAAERASTIKTAAVAAAVSAAVGIGVGKLIG